ncbi:hypothetical protein HMPREF9080_00332, partial [Cardiobacterium valvarum F0432]
FEVEDAAGADFATGVVDGAVALEKQIACAEGVAITASSKQGNKQNRQQHHLCPQAGCTLCRFCGRSHGVMGRGKDAGIMPVLSRQAVSCWGRSSGIKAGFVQKYSPSLSRFFVFAKVKASVFGIATCFAAG